MNFSIGVLVSRVDALFERCVEYLKLQTPERFIFGISRRISGDLAKKFREIIKPLEKISEVSTFYLVPSKNFFEEELGYGDIVDLSHTEWIRFCRDTDFLIGDTAEIIEEGIPLHKDFLVYGNSIVRKPGRDRVSVINPKIIVNPEDANWYIGGGVWRVKFLRGIHKSVCPGPYLDQRIIVKLLQKYSVRYVDRVVYFRNSDHNRGFTWNFVYKCVEEGTFSKLYDRIRREENF